MATKPNLKDYTNNTYTSKYESQLADALDKVTNRQDFTYDPLKDASYQALAKIYTKRGEQARQNTLGDAAALTGGIASSYATSAAAQAQSDYNQQLAAQIPALQEAAYNRYMNDYNMNVSALGALRDAEDAAYGRYRDTVADKQWQYGAAWDDYRAGVSDSQWQQSFDRDKYESDRNYNYQVNRDKTTDKQWQQEFNLKKKSVASSSSSRSGYNGSSSNTTGSDDFNEKHKKAQQLVKDTKPGTDAVTKLANSLAGFKLPKNNKKVNGAGGSYSSFWSKY